LIAKKPIILVTAIMLLATLSFGNVLPAHAVIWTLNLDASSPTPTDITVETTANQTHSFRIGAVLNASATNPLNGVFGWQFSINYNATAFIPQGDPSGAAIPGNLGGLYVDSASNTVLFGAGSSPGQINWAAKITAAQAFGSSTIIPGQITVFYTILAPNIAVNIAAPTLMANVNFELLTRVSPSVQTFSISNVIFVNNAGATISGLNPGAPITENIMDIPPIAKFTATGLPTGSTLCTPVTGVACTANAFQFDGTASTDADGTISGAAGTAGFFWDFGDGTQDGFYPFSTFNVGTVTCTNPNLVTFTCQGAVAVHDYGVAGKFNVTLHVQDNSLDTGSARDALGGLILNGQPSHTQRLNLVVPPVTATPPTVIVNAPTPNPANEGAPGVTVTWAVSSNGATVTASCINWGDGSSACGLVGTTSATHIYTTGSVASKMFTITVNATNSAGTGSGRNTVTINDLAPTVTVTAPASANEGATVSVSFTATDDEAISKTCVNFGDGSSVCGASPQTHVYHLAGTSASVVFTITVNATDAAGKTGSNTASITINDLTPVVTITSVSPSPATSGQTVSVVFTATDDEAISKTCIAWGDGVSACGITSPVTHMYTVSVSTIFTIAVNATDAAGLTGSNTASETVNPVSIVPPPVVTVNAPTPNPALTGQTVSVTWTVTSTATVTASCINWGDGASACGLVGTTSATHMYANTGNAMSETFTITVNATNSGGTGQGTNMETVNDRPPIAVIAGPSTATTGQIVTFDGSGSTDPDGTITNFSWSFGDGTSGAGAIVTHTYTTVNTFVVTLTVTDNSGKTNSTTHSITVIAPTVHARLAHGKASPAHHHFSISKDGSTQTFFAIGLDDGQTAVLAYVIFHVTGDGGVNTLTFTQVATLQVGGLIDGKTNATFSSAYTVTAVPAPIGSYSVTAEIFFNSNLSATCTPTTSAPVCAGFTGDTASEKTFSFAVVA
jgi:hypothetical protein